MKSIVFRKTTSNAVSVNGRKLRLYITPVGQMVYIGDRVYLFDDWEIIKRNGVVSFDMFTYAGYFNIYYCCPELTEVEDSHRHVKMLLEDLDVFSLTVDRTENVELWRGACDAADISLVCSDCDSKSLCVHKCGYTDDAVELACVLWVMHHLAEMRIGMDYTVTVLDPKVGVTTCSSVGVE